MENTINSGLKPFARSGNGCAIACFRRKCADDCAHALVTTPWHVDLQSLNRELPAAKAGRHGTRNAACINQA